MCFGCSLRNLCINFIITLMLHEGVKGEAAPRLNASSLHASAESTYTGIELFVNLQTLGCFQIWTYAYVRLLNKPYGNEVTLREQN